MLKKLFIHEWKSFSKVPGAINLCLILLTLVGIVSLISPIWTLEYDIIAIFMVLAIMIYYLSIIAGSIAVTVYTAMRYYKNVYTDEGYLTNTLPVTPRQIILSKLYVSSIWHYITSIVITVSVFALVYVGLYSYDGINLFQEFATAWDTIMEAMAGEMGLDVFAILLGLIISLLISPFFSIVMLYSSIALGQLFKKHKVAGAVMWYIIEYLVIQFVSSLIVNVPLFTGLMEVEMNDTFPFLIINLVLYGSLLLTIAATVGLYFISEYMLKKKLNLD